MKVRNFVLLLTCIFIGWAFGNMYVRKVCILVKWPTIMHVCRQKYYFVLRDNYPDLKTILTVIVIWVQHKPLHVKE